MPERPHGREFPDLLQPRCGVFGQRRIPENAALEHGQGVVHGVQQWILSHGRFVGALVRRHFCLIDVEGFMQNHLQPIVRRGDEAPILKPFGCPILGPVEHVLQLVAQRRIWVRDDQHRDAVDLYRCVLVI